MKILPLHPDLEKYLAKRNLEAKFEKQKRIFEKNPFHSGLNTELLQPRKMKIWSFRIDQKYRAIFIFRRPDEAEIIDINDHYR
jgi:Txe/YoeB family toxin of Txe-Axe toxin-antitoxin module